METIESVRQVEEAVICVLCLPNLPYGKLLRF